MAEKRARVVLRGAKSYSYKGFKFIERVPKVVKGDDIVEELQNNGYFKVTLLKSKKVESVDEDEKPKKKKKVKKKASSKKVSKKKKKLRR